MVAGVCDRPVGGRKKDDRVVDGRRNVSNRGVPGAGERPRYSEVAVGRDRHNEAIAERYNAAGVDRSRTRNAAEASMASTAGGGGLDPLIFVVAVARNSEPIGRAVPPGARLSRLPKPIQEASRQGGLSFVTSKPQAETAARATQDARRRKVFMSRPSAIEMPIEASAVWLKRDRYLMSGGRGMQKRWWDLVGNARSWSHREAAGTPIEVYLAECLSQASSLLAGSRRRK